MDAFLLKEKGCDFQIVRRKFKEENASMVYEQGRFKAIDSVNAV